MFGKNKARKVVDSNLCIQKHAPKKEDINRFIEENY